MRPYINMWWSAVAVCLHLAGASAVSAQQCMAYVGDTSIGGHLSDLDQSPVCEWLGIPYAEPPIGDRRFAAPVALPVSTASFNADSWGFDCPQTQASYFAYPNATAQYATIYANFVNQLNNTQSEDCLTLNVWSKATNDSAHASPKPVLVYIYGGRFSAGTSNTPFYHGQYLAAAQDIIVVTFNFRINIFGFPGAPALPSKNLGLLDQHMAVSWVRDHIAAFGGDPTRITVAGQSSGSWAVGNWAYAFKEDPIVAGFISHSGNVFSFNSNTADLAASNWNTVAAALGCTSSSSSSAVTLACMRSPNITMAAILAAAATVPTTGSITRPLAAFQITQDNLTVFSTTDYATRLAAGDLARLPYLETHNDHESGFYRIPALAKGGTNGVLPESNWTLFEQETFTCPYAVEARGRAVLGSVSYRMRYMADWEDLRLFYQDDAPFDSGAYHGVDINMVIGNVAGVNGGLVPEEEGVRLTDTMQRAWAAFVTDPEEGLEEVMGWPRYEDGKETLILVGVNTTAEVDFVNPAMYDYICPSLGLEFWNTSRVV